ncbi:MAG TPA: hypothetical protein VFG42_16145 [Baekduia sp.]|uniref:hypothetical protein n=1 Tax=Baekduia sp. TaxID=2600305 RepID=UPI002D769D30|nr:hypothetical protein [Baekduia sp.]HET6508325.1 hypothetical protein [Baekduia sp.]
MIGRVRRAFGALAPDQRLAGAAALGLFVTMFLPWYTRDTTAVVGGKLQTVGSTLMAWKAFSFVEAAILLVAVGVLALLFARGERKAFHLPGGDGLVITAAGVWVALLVFYRLIDNKTGSTSEFQKVDYGVSWGIFVTLLCGIALAYTGQRIRQARLSEPPLPGEGPDGGAPPRGPGGPAGPAAPAGPASPAPTVTDRRPGRTAAEREAERAAREQRRRGDTGETAVVPAPPPTTRAPAAAPTERLPPRPEIDGGTQLSFDEQE